MIIEPSPKLCDGINDYYFFISVILDTFSDFRGWSSKCSFTAEVFKEQVCRLPHLKHHS